MIYFIHFFKTHYTKDGVYHILFISWCSIFILYYSLGTISPLIYSFLFLLVNIIFISYVILFILSITFILWRHYILANSLSIVFTSILILFPGIFYSRLQIHSHYIYFGRRLLSYSIYFLLMINNIHRLSLLYLQGSSFISLGINIIEIK